MDNVDNLLAAARSAIMTAKVAMGSDHPMWTRCDEAQALLDPDSSPALSDKRLHYRIKGDENEIVEVDAEEVNNLHAAFAAWQMMEPRTHKEAAAWSNVLEIATEILDDRLGGGDRAAQDVEQFEQ